MKACLAREQVVAFKHFKCKFWGLNYFLVDNVKFIAGCTSHLCSKYQAGAKYNAGSMNQLRYQHGVDSLTFGTRATSGYKGSNRLESPCSNRHFERSTPQPANKNQVAYLRAPFPFSFFA